MNIEHVLSALETGLKTIWMDTPADLQGLKQIHRPPSGDMPHRVYANFDVYWIAGIYYFFYRKLQEPKANQKVLADLLSDFSKESAGRVAKWGLADASAVISLAATAFEEAGLPSEDLTKLTESLIVYLNRLQAWIDWTIPWAAMDTLKAQDHER